jgi:hypothetical protein
MIQVEISSRIFEGATPLPSGTNGPVNVGKSNLTGSLVYTYQTITLNCGLLSHIEIHWEDRQGIISNL